MEQDAVIIIKSYIPLTLYQTDIQKIYDLMIDRDGGCERVEMFYNSSREIETENTRHFELNSNRYKLQDPSEISQLEDGQTYIRNLLIVGHNPSIKIILNNSTARIESKQEKAELDRENIGYSLVLRIDEILSSRSSKWNSLLKKWSLVPISIIILLPFIILSLYIGSKNRSLTIDDYIEATTGLLFSISFLIIFCGLAYNFVKHSHVRIIKGSPPSTIRELIRRNRDDYVYFILRDGFIAIIGIVIGVLLDKFILNH